AEGTEAMPPPASLAIPLTPASQAGVTPTPPQITSDRTTPVPTAPITLATVPRPEVEASSAPPTPQDEPLPAIAQEPSAPPRPEVAPADRPVPPKVSVQTVRAPAVEADAELEAVPLPDAVAKPDVAAPVAAAERPAVQAPAVTPADLQRPVAGADTAPAPPGQVPAPGESPAGESTAQAAKDGQGKSGEKTSSSQGQGTTPAPAMGPPVASASGTGSPGATAADSAGTPGSPNGVDDSQRMKGANGTSQRDDGVVGGQGDKTGEVGSYVELKPRGDVTVQPGQHVKIEYKSTRFDKDWTPKNESSVDTAVRQAADKATTHFTVPLPRGLRVNCVAGPGNSGGKMNAVSLFTLGCGGDPPPKPDHDNADNLVKNQTMAPSKPLAADLPPANASTVGARPVAIDNTAFCATARVAGGPLPAGCEPSIKINVPAKPQANDRASTPVHQRRQQQDRPARQGCVKRHLERGQGADEQQRHGQGGDRQTQEAATPVHGLTVAIRHPDTPGPHAERLPATQPGKQEVGRDDQGLQWLVPPGLQMSFRVCELPSGRDLGEQAHHHHDGDDGQRVVDDRRQAAPGR
ncbi:hypothetical protein KCV01_g13061, partial [Aureobasidium melanogenum]